MVLFKATEVKGEPLSRSLCCGVCDLAIGQADKGAVIVKENARGGNSMNRRGKERRRKKLRRLQESGPGVARVSISSRYCVGKATGVRVRGRRGPA